MYMKKTQLLIGVSLMLATACSKKDKGSTPSGTISTTISTQIAKTDTLSTFNKFFTAAALTDAELSEGVTVFAPSNSAFGNASVNGSGPLPDESVIKDYIVKGILTEADFIKGKTLTTLSGKTLTVSVVVDPVILVNGLQSHLDQATEDLLVSLGTTDVDIVGGPNSVTPGIESDLAILMHGSNHVHRYSGATRYDAALSMKVAPPSNETEPSTTDVPDHE